jgi:hypothetical protein
LVLLHPFHFEEALDQFVSFQGSWLVRIEHGTFTAKGQSFGAAKKLLRKHWRT